MKEVGLERIRLVDEPLQIGQRIFAVLASCTLDGLPDFADRQFACPRVTD
jgi:hypothetical protein